MKIYLTEQEVIELAYDALDMNCPDPDKVHDIALKMDMIYNEYLDMYEDPEEVSLRKIRRIKSDLQKSFEDRKEDKANTAMCSCGVPNDLHSSTMCGWDAALMPSNEFGVINDSRHPGYGRPFMSWRTQY